MESSESGPCASSQADGFLNLVRIVYIFTIINDVGCIYTVEFLLQGGPEHFAFVFFEVVIPSFDGLDDVLVGFSLLQDIEPSFLLLLFGLDVFQSSLGFTRKRVWFPYNVGEESLEVPDSFIAVKDKAGFCLAIEVCCGSSAFEDEHFGFGESAIISIVNVFPEKCFFGAVEQLIHYVIVGIGIVLIPVSCKW